MCLWFMKILCPIPKFDVVENAATVLMFPVLNLFLILFRVTLMLIIKSKTFRSIVFLSFCNIKDFVASTKG